MATKQEMANASNEALKKFISQGAETTQNDVKSSSMGISTPGKQKARNGANRRVTRVFSFRADIDSVAQFRAYCFAKYKMTVDEVGERAMIEYMENHPLEKFEKDSFKARLTEEQIYNEELKRKEAEKQSKK